jgi:glycosyltransferase involved in cell wall biosynthesis
VLDKNNNLINITAIILTYNEEKHLERCILSIKDITKKIIIVDSFSTDETLNIAKKYKVEILQNKFINQSKQLNWALDRLTISTDWILRIDADEYFSNKLKEKISEKFKTDQKNLSGFSVNRKIKFFGKILNFGGLSPHKTLRIWKKNKGMCHDAWMDEQISVEGEVQHINECLVDHNLNKLSWWLNKHKSYAVREAINYLLTKDNSKKNYKIPDDATKISKYYKIKVYYQFPIFLRPCFLFFYYYFLKLGFLSGWQGFVFYFLQAIWFRSLVDFNILKLKRFMKKEKITLKDTIKIKYGYNEI